MVFVGHFTTKVLSMTFVAVLSTFVVLPKIADVNWPFLEKKRVKKKDEKRHKTHFFGQSWKPCFTVKAF